MIKPDQIPEFTGDLAQLDLDYAALKKDAGDVRGTGADINSQFQGLAAFYKAPEAEKLFATTKPVQDRADTFGTHLETVSGALSSYATEIRPLVSKLADLKVQAQTFVNSVKDDDDWEYDGDKVDKHNRLRDQITETVAAFWAAERTCHNKITGIWGGTQMVAGDGSDRKDQYGYNAADLKNAQLPWGDPVEERHHWYEVGHWVKSFVWDGVIVDGIWGTIKGLGTLVGFGGWDAMGQAWKGLAQLATGLALASLPVVGTAFWLVPDDKLPSWIRDSRTAMKETGKALVAWDEWGKNPGRAAGAVTFNVLTTVFTGGAGGAAAGAGKAGAVAKALSIAGKAGKVIDPMTYIAKGAGAGLSKIGDITKGLKGIGKIDVPQLPDGTFKFPEGHILAPDGTLTPVDATSLPHQPVTPAYHVPTDLPNQWSHVPDNGGVHTPGTHTPVGAAYAVDNAGVPHLVENTPAHLTDAASGVHYGDMPPWYHEHATVPAHDIPAAVSHEATTPAGHTAPHEPTPHTTIPHDTTTPHHPGEPPHGTGHDTPGHGHDTPAHDPAAHDTTPHTGDAPHTWDNVDVTDHTPVHHGPDVPAAPAHSAADAAAHTGGVEPFEYRPHMSDTDFANLATDADKHAAAAAELADGTNPLPSSSDWAGKEYGDAHWQDFLDNLDPKAKDALERYTSFWYSHINGPLRDIAAHPGGVLDPKIQHIVDNMDRVMGGHPVPENVMVVRGTGIDHLPIRSAAEMQGHVYSDAGFTSTSLGKNAAFDYKPVILHLRVPKGTPALWLDPISASKGERELLLARDTQFKVTRVFMDQSGKWHAYGEVLPHPRAGTGVTP